MGSRDEQEPRLSVRRAFVVHLAAGGASGRRRFSGRVEHLSSGESAHFSSLKELLAFFGGICDASTPAGPLGRAPHDQPSTPSRTDHALHAASQAITGAGTDQTRRASSGTDRGAAAPRISPE